MKRGIEFLSRWWIISSDVKNLLKFFSESKKKNFEYTWSLSRIQELLPLFSKFIIRLLKVESWRFFSILEREREREKNFRYLFLARWNSFSNAITRSWYRAARR